MRVFHWLIVIFSLPVLLHGQSPDSSECSRRSIPLAVLDREYHLIENLKPADLRIKARDQSVVVQQMALTSPRRLMLLLDVSGSMVQKNKWHVLQLLAHDLIRAAPADVEIALATFAQDYGQIVGYTLDRNVLRDALKGLTYESLKQRKGPARTMLVDALLMATRQSNPRAMGDSIYVLTDGDDNRSDNRIADVKREILRRGMRAYFFFIRERGYNYHEINSSDVGRLATTSGGYIIDLAASRPQISLAYSSTEFYYELSQDNLRALATAASILYTPMFRFYSVELRIPEALYRLNSKLKITVVDGAGKKLKNVDVIHARELLRCAASGP